MRPSTKYKEFLVEYQKFVESKIGLKRFLLYGPMSEAYWDEPIRILICNLEPYSINSNVPLVVDYECIDQKLGWLWNKTIVFSTIQALALMNRVENIKNTKDKLKQMFNDYDLLENTLKRIAYMNLRITNGKFVGADKKNIKMNVERTKEMINKQIKILNPHVIFVGGETGIKEFNVIFETSIQFHGIEKINNKMIVISIRHPSRSKYEEIIENSNLVRKHLTTAST